MQSNVPSLTSSHAIASLTPRRVPYWNTIEYGRHIGVVRLPSGDFWIARARTSTGGKYIQKRLAPVDFMNACGLDHERALLKAQDWFRSKPVVAVATRAIPIGVNRTLRYSKRVSEFTIGDAMVDYVAWKRIVAAESHFTTNLSLINHHIIPRLGNTPISGLSNWLFTDFCRDVLETPPKRGNQVLGPRKPLSQIDPEALRKRKKTLNTLIGILRLAIRLAWENGAIEDERVWRRLRRVPCHDAPRHRFLNRAECRALIAACRPDLAQLVLGSLYSGCRVSELSNLRVRDVGSEVFGIYVAPLKSYRGRYVFLPEEGMSFFLDQCSGKTPDELVFRDHRHRKWLGGHKHLFRDAVQRAGLPKGFVFHGLRHTYASQLVQAGTPLAIVARQLGHSNTDTVSRTYGHLSCISVESELATRFAPLLPHGEVDKRLGKLRSAISLSGENGFGETLAQVREFGLAGGELVGELLRLDRQR